MARSTSNAAESKRLAFLTMFFARAHRTLYRAQNVAELGEELGFSTAEARACAHALQRRGLLRSLSSLAGDGPLMEITPAGISRVQESIATEARSEAR
jgi:hypothetical protein